MVTPTSGKIKVIGLDAGKYYLKETVAPTGFNLLAEDVDVTVKPTSGFNADTAGNSVSSSYPETAPLQVINKNGQLLPSTGGMGTTVFYLVGGVLILAAVAAFIFKRKKNAL